MGSFFAPEIDMIFGDGVGASLECESAIGRKIAASYDISANDIRRCVALVPLAALGFLRCHVGHCEILEGPSMLG